MKRKQLWNKIKLWNILIKLWNSRRKLEWWNFARGPFKSFVVWLERIFPRIRVDDCAYDVHTYSHSIETFSNKRCRCKGKLRPCVKSYAPKMKENREFEEVLMELGGMCHHGFPLTRSVCFFLKIFSQTVHGNSLRVLTDSSISACTLRIWSRNAFLLLDTRPQYLHVSLAA